MEAEQVVGRLRALYGDSGVGGQRTNFDEEDQLTLQTSTRCAPTALVYSSLAKAGWGRPTSVRRSCIILRGSMYRTLILESCWGILAE